MLTAEAAEVAGKRLLAPAHVVTAVTVRFRFIARDFFGNQDQSFQIRSSLPMIVGGTTDGCWRCYALSILSHIFSVFFVVPF